MTVRVVMPLAARTHAEADDVSGLAAVIDHALDHGGEDEFHGVAHLAAGHHYGVRARHETAGNRV